MKNGFQILLGIVIGMIVSAAIFLVISPPRGKAIELLPAPTQAPIVVHVDGAVANPGVYTLARDSRVQDAINAAGGVSPQANLDTLNLAARLKDGDKLLILAQGTAMPPNLTPEPTARKSKTIATGTTSGPINLNTATLEELQTLPGIGETRAQDIIDYRQAHNGFKAIDEIQNISGIGTATFEKLKEHITVQ